MVRYEENAAASSGGSILLWILIPVGVLVLLLIFGIVMYNGFVKSDMRVKEAFSTMDVYLMKRWEMVPKLVDVVKAYAAHEQDTLTRLTQMRNSAYGNMSNEDKIRANTELSEGIGRLMALAESYPELKSSDNFLELGKQLYAIEDEIANARKYYNGAVRLYNTKVVTFPNSMIAHMFHFTEKEMYEAAADARGDVNVSL